MAQVYRFTDENGQVRLMAEIDPAPGGGPADGTYLPVAAPTGVTVDTTTYNDTVKGSGKLTTLVFPSEQGAFALALAGDAFPRFVVGTDPRGVGIIGFGDGTADVFGGTSSAIYFALSGGGNLIVSAGAGSGIQTGSVFLSPAAAANGAPPLSQLSPLFTITSGALPTLTISSGVGRQILTSRDAETVTPFTGDGTNNTATCAIAISPDNVTYSTVATISIAAALNLTGVLTDTVNARVPAGWYVKLTAVHGTLGTTTYY